MVDEVVTAYHESGHVVSAESFGGLVLSVTIIPTDDEGPRRHGETRVAWKQPKNKTDARRLAIAQMNVALAGPVAEMIYCDEQYEIEILREWWADWLVATRTIQSIAPGRSEHEIETLLRSRLEELVAWASRPDTWHRIACIADELEAHETLGQDQLDELRATGIL